jgi:hypothetical protein
MRNARPPIVEDDLERQRRKRDQRLLDQAVPDHPTMTVGDVVAEVLAAGSEGDAGFDVAAYLTEQGHSWPTIDTVLRYLERQNAPAPPSPPHRRPLP